MDTRKAIAYRIITLCVERNMTPNRLATQSAVPASTMKSILNGASQNPGVVTIKKLCDGLNISLKEFFDTEVFENLEQEIR